MSYLSNVKLSNEEFQALFNFRKVCSTLATSDFLLAREQLEDQSKFVKKYANQDLSILFLDNLNMSLYQFFLNRFNLSMHTLAYENTKLLHTVFNLSQFKKVADKILHSYFLSSSSLLKKSHGNISEIVEFVRDNLHRDFNLDDLGGHVFLNKCYLCSLFKNVTGMSLSQFINQERVKKSEILLATTDETIADIAKLCGFRSTTYFSTVFKALNDMTPREYRLRISESQTNTNKKNSSANFIED